MRSPRLVVWATAALVALGIAGPTYRIPIQVSDSLEVIQRVHTAPAVSGVFLDALKSSPTMLRPMRQVQTKLLLDAATAMGGGYQAAFRGYHALLLAVLIALFIAAIPVNTWADAAVAILGLTVLVGLHTFSSFFREAYPINHFLLIAIATLATFKIASSNGSRTADAAASLLLVAALLTLESGVLVWVVAVAAYASGLRGVSRRALIVMSLLLIGYAVFRQILGIHPPIVGDRPTGFGVSELTPAAQIARFAANPVPFYAYNASMSMLSVLLSQPRAGRWTLVSAAASGHVAPVFYLQLASSLAATGVLAWYLTRKGERGLRRWREPVPLVFLSVLGANCILSYAYTKDEIVSPSGVFYALAVSAAVRELFDRSRVTAMRAVTAGVLVVFTAAWSIRAAAAEPLLLRAMFNARSDWAGVMAPGRPGDWPQDPGVRALTLQLKRDALEQRVVPPASFPRWVVEWGGEE